MVSSVARGFAQETDSTMGAACAVPVSLPFRNQSKGHESRTYHRTSRDQYMRIGIITGLFDRKSEYRTSTIACLFDERLGLYDE